MLGEYIHCDLFVVQWLSCSMMYMVSQKPLGLVVVSAPVDLRKLPSSQKASAFELKFFVRQSL